MLETLVMVSGETQDFGGNVPIGVFQAIAPVGDRLSEIRVRRLNLDESSFSRSHQ